MDSPPSNLSSTSLIHFFHTPPIVEEIPKYEFLVNNMPVRGADTCTVHIWLDHWFWAKHMDITTRLQVSRVTWNAANVYTFSKRQLRHDLLKWGFEKNLAKELVRDVIKARNIVRSYSSRKFRFSRLIRNLFRRQSRY